MAIRSIVFEGDALLRKKSRIVTDFNGRLHALLDDMAETMAAADGVGLAAPQVGILRRAVVIDVGEGLIELINPEIIATEGEQDGPEGCLSVPERQGMVIRPLKVRVKAQDRNGNWFELEGEELLARACCHEIDHLDGVLFIDKMYKECTFEEENAQEEQGE